MHGKYMYIHYIHYFTVRDYVKAYDNFGGRHAILTFAHLDKIYHFYAFFAHKTYLFQLFAPTYGGPLRKFVFVCVLHF